MWRCQRSHAVRACPGPCPRLVGASRWPLAGAPCFGRLAAEVRKVGKLDLVESAVTAARAHPPRAQSARDPTSPGCQLRYPRLAPRRVPSCRAAPGCTGERVRALEPDSPPPCRRWKLCARRSCAHHLPSASHQTRAARGTPSDDDAMCCHAQAADAPRASRQR